MKLKDCFRKTLAMMAMISLLFQFGLAPIALAAEDQAATVTPNETSAITPSVTPDSTVSIPETPAPVEVAPVPTPEPTPESTPGSEVSPSPIPTAEPTPQPTPSVIPDINPTPSTTSDLTQSSVGTINNVIQPIWTNSGDTATTTNNVELNQTYVAPQNSSVTVKFTKLPETAGYLTIKEVTLTNEQVKQTGALLKTAYDITSDMADGTFEYALTLPKPANQENVEIKFAETVAGLKNADTVATGDVTTETDSVSASLDHFTIFVVTNGGSNGTITPTSCSGATGSVNSITITDSDQCFNSIQAAIDAVVAPDKTINVAAGTYTEPLIISGKTNLTIQGVGTTTVIEPTSGIGIEVRTSNDITIKNLKIYTTGGAAHGILVDGTGTGGFGTPLGGVSNNLRIENTTIDAGGTGIWGDSSADGVHSGWLITGNTITAQEGGIGFQDVTNSTVSYNTITTPAVGTNILWTSERYALSTLSIDHNTVSGSAGSEVAVITDYNEREGGIMREDSLVHSTIAGITFSNNTFSNWGTAGVGRAIRVGQGDDTVTTGTVTGISITGNTFQMTIDTPEVIGGTDAPSATGSGNIFKVSGTAKIQTSVNAAFTGDTINVAAGTYNENLTISKSLILDGPNAGVDPNIGTRVIPEAIIDGGDGFTIKPEATNITINGFTIKSSNIGEPIYNVGADAADISGMNISYNIVGTGARAISLESDGSNISILHNQLGGYTHDIVGGDGTWNNLKINDNYLLEPTDGSYAIQMGPDGTGLVDGFELKNNHIFGSNNIGSNITNGTVSGNVFDQGAPGDLELQIALHNSTVSNNTFLGHTTSSCLQLFGSQYGLVPSNTVTVSGNTFTDCGAATSAPYAYAIQLSQGIDNINIISNTITNAYDGINTRIGIGGWDFTGKNIHANGNTITGSREFAINNTVTGTFDATKNWFGSKDLATVSAGIFGTVSYKPYYIDAAMKTLSDIKAITGFTIAGQMGTTTIDEVAHTIALTMPADTNVTALVPTITTTGSSVSPASAVSNNFSAPVTYTATSIDEASPQAYTVTVTVAPDTSKGYHANKPQDKKVAIPVVFTPAANTIQAVTTGGFQGLNGTRVVLANPVNSDVSVSPTPSASPTVSPTPAPIQKDILGTQNTNPQTKNSNLTWYLIGAGIILLGAIGYFVRRKQSIN